MKILGSGKCYEDNQSEVLENTASSHWGGDI